MEHSVNFSVLVGKTIKDIIRSKPIDDDEIIFVCDDDTRYRMYHYQECCESVNIEDIVGGDLNNLIGKYIIDAYESNNGNYTEYSDEEWTFYTIITMEITYVIRWYGSSNGYYGTSVNFDDIT
jgi:hypothetical protein